METNIHSIEKIAETFADSVIDLGFRLLSALLIYLIGRFVINRLVKAMGKLRLIKKLDVTARNYLMNFTKALLYVALIVSVVAVLGVPVTSVIAVLAAAGAAIGLALQGSLANFAGGLMLLIFRPFSVGDYIHSGDDQGFVRSISLVYTELRTFDNRIVSIPNGTLMNSRIVNTTSEELRRVDLKFDISDREETDKVEYAMFGPIYECGQILRDPKPVVVPSAIVTDGVTYSVRVWVNTPDYWDVYEYLVKEIPAALNEAGIERPYTPIRVSSPQTDKDRKDLLTEEVQR